MDLITLIILVVASLVILMSISGYFKRNSVDGKGLWQTLVDWVQKRLAETEVERSTEFVDRVTVNGTISKEDVVAKVETSNELRALVR